MIIKNPSVVDARIIFEGVEKIVEAGKEIEVGEAFGAHWLEIHSFLQVVTAPVKAVKEVKKVVKEVKEDK